MSTGKLLNETTLHGFANHPRDVLKELINAAKTNRDAATMENEREDWRNLVDQLIRAYNVAPMRR